jgi:hypothetical protein
MSARSEPLPLHLVAASRARPLLEGPGRSKRADGESGSPRPLSPPPLFELHARQAAFVVGLVIVVWIAFVFARAVAATSAANDHAAQLRASIAAEQARLASDQEELAIVQGQPFIRLQARAYGVGAPGEHPFSLAAGAPSPQPIVPLGEAASPPAKVTPLDAWLTMLFGP